MAADEWGVIKDGVRKVAGSIPSPVTVSLSRTLTGSDSGCQEGRPTHELPNQNADQSAVATPTEGEKPKEVAFSE